MVKIVLILTNVQTDLTTVMKTLFAQIQPDHLNASAQVSLAEMADLVICAHLLNVGIMMLKTKNVFQKILVLRLPVNREQFQSLLYLVFSVQRL